MTHVYGCPHDPTDTAVTTQVRASLEETNDAKLRRKLEFESTDDVIIGQEMAAAKAHVASHGEIH